MIKNKIYVLILIFTYFVITGFCHAYSKSISKEKTVNSELRNLSGKKIAINAGKRTIIIELYDNATANDLLSQLPLTLKSSDYLGYDEKVIRLKTPLSMAGAPKGDNPLIPEFGYYHPSQWLAIYYGPIGYWSGKVPLGKINATIEELKAIPNNIEVKIEEIKK